MEPVSSTSTRTSSPPATTVRRRSRRVWRSAPRPRRHGTRDPLRDAARLAALPLDEEREREVRAGARTPRASAARLELRLGFELTPRRELLDDDPARYALEGTDVVLIEVPFYGPLSALVERSRSTSRAPGLTPIVAHPERAEPIRAEPERAIELRRAGWLAAGERDEPARQPRPRAARSSPGGSSTAASSARRLRRAPRCPARRASTRRSSWCGREWGRSAALPLFDGHRARARDRHRKRCLGQLRATAPISRSEARRVSDSISIWRTRSRVSPSRRPISSSVFGSSSRGRSGASSTLPLALGERLERPRRAPGCAARRSTSSSGQRPVAGDEVAEDGVLLLADRLVEARRGPRGGPHLDAPAGAAGSPPRRSPRATARGRAASRGAARRGSSSASARRCGRASRIVRALSASARATAWRIHQVA